MKFEIGQEVWRCAFEMTTNHIQCPDCTGTGRLRVLFADDSMVSIECRNCASGYEPPRGYLTVHDREPFAKLVTITGVEIDDGKTRWRTNDSYRVDEAELFLTEAEAFDAAKIMAAQFDEAERQKILQKEKDTRTWAWNATYHRNCIKRAQKEIDYHTKKLAVASLKAKEDKSLRQVAAE
jgi:hypothetical protein